MLIIQGLPDDVNIKQVIVNNNEAKYNYASGRYEIRSKEDEYNVEVILSDMLATMTLGTNEAKQGQDSIQIAKDTNNYETILNVTVTSQSGLVTENYTIAILEQSKNNNLDSIIVNEQNVTQGTDGVYYIGLPHNTEKIDIVATAEDEIAITKIQNTPNTSHIATYSEVVVGRKNNI